MALAAGVYLSEAHYPPRFLFGVVKQFCRFGIWSNTCTKCITHVDALHTTRSPPYYTLYKYISLYLFTEGKAGMRERGGEVNQREG